MRADDWDRLAAAFSAEELAAKGLVKVRRGFRVVAAAESQSEHPIARAVMKYANVRLSALQGFSDGATPSLPRVSDVEIVPGEGLRCRVEGVEVVMGNGWVFSVACGRFRKNMIRVVRSL